MFTETGRFSSKDANLSNTLPPKELTVTSYQVTTTYYRCPFCETSYDCNNRDGQKEAEACLKRCMPKGVFANFSYDERTVYAHNHDNEDKIEACGTVRRVGQLCYAWIPEFQLGMYTCYFNGIRRRDDRVIEFGIGKYKTKGDIVAWVTGDQMYYGGK